MKQTEIARELDCSQMQVSRLLRRAADRLREITDPTLDDAPDDASSTSGEQRQLA
jgi:DNA-directed RNA polymerase specialized sigma24 family protein